MRVSRDNTSRNQFDANSDDVLRVIDESEGGARGVEVIDLGFNKATVIRWGKEIKTSSGKTPFTSLVSTGIQWVCRGCECGMCCRGGRSHRLSPMSALASRGEWFGLDSNMVYVKAGKVSIYLWTGGWPIADY
jgi:hypothetical protein